MSTSSPHDRSQPDAHNRLRQALHSAQRLFFGSVRRTLILLLFVVFIGVAVEEISHYRNLFEEEAQDEYKINLEVARFAATAFENSIRFILREEEELGAYFSTSQPLAQDRANALIASGAAEAPAVRYFAWIDPQARAVAATDPDVRAQDFGDSAFFQPFVQGRDRVVTDLFQDGPTGQATFVVARAVRDQQGVLQGIVAAALDPAHLGGLVTVQRPGQDTILIIDGHGMLVYMYPETPVSWEQRNLLASDPFLPRALAGEAVTGRFESSIDGLDRMGAWVPMASLGWVARASSPEAAAMAPIVRDLVREAVVDGAILVAAFVLALLIGRTITAPLGRMQEYATAVGRGQYGSRPEISGPIELERLSAAFNRMSEEIRTREVQLRQANLSLRIYEHVVTSTALPILVVDAQYVVRVVNPACTQFFGVSADQAVGYPVERVFGRENFESVFRPVLEMRSSTLRPIRRFW